MRTFTSLGDMLRSAGKGKWGHDDEGEIGRRIKESVSKKLQNENEEEE
jgi:hypothetical protein